MTMRTCIALQSVGVSHSCCLQLVVIATSVTGNLQESLAWKVYTIWTEQELHIKKLPRPAVLTADSNVAMQLTATVTKSLPPPNMLF